MPARRTTSLAAAALASLATTLLAVVPSAGAGPDTHRSAPTRAGQLDPTFSPAGRAGITDPIASRQFVDVAVQHDGKIVAVSDQGGDFAIYRFNADGTTDTTFAGTGTGVRQVDVGGAGQTDQAFAVAVDGQNRIVVVGSGGAAVPDAALVRLSPDGTAVQINTHLHIGNGADASPLVDVAFQSDGTIVAAGTAKVGADTDFALARFNGLAGGVIGTPVTRTFGTGNETARGLAVYPSGPQQDKIVVVGNTGTTGNSAMVVAQYTANGGEDASYAGGAGEVVLDPTAGNDLAVAAAVTASGSVVVAGQGGGADSDIVVAQLLPSGTSDPAFNSGALRTIVKPGSEFIRSRALAIQPDGKIVLVGDTNSGQDVGVFRLGPNGGNDQSFGTAGDGSFDVAGNDDGNAVAIDGAGRIVLVGDDTASAGFVARLLGVSDSDGDGVGDPFDACPSVPGPLTNGCPAPSPPEAVLKGKKVVLDTVLAKKAASAKCPDKAKVVVKSKSSTGKIKVTKRLGTTTVAGGCRAKGKVNLHVKPKKSAAVKVTVTGKKLRTKRLVAVRQ